LPNCITIYTAPFE